ncbi:MAG: hypothetical protein ACKPEA_16130 [Planctomycetota bacterium]
MTARTLLVSLLAGLVLGSAAFGAAPPPPAPAVLAMSSNADEAARKSIQAFIDHHMKLIETGNPDEVKESRNALASVLRKSECTLVFYRTFMQLATPSIERILASGENFRAVNALRVVAQAKCEEAMSLMLAQGSAATQKDAPIRIASAAMVATMVKFGDGDATKKLDSVSRRIRENVEAETVALAASQDMMALGAVATKAEADKMAAQVRGALEELVKATGAAATRAAQAGAGDFNAAIFRGLIAIRDVCVKLPNAEQGAVAPIVAPLLEQVEALPGDAGAKAGAAQRELTAAKAVCEALRGMLGLKGAAKK